jgi:hypothetical protein
VKSELLALSSPELDQYFGYNINQIENNLLEAARVIRPLGTMDNFGEALHQGHQTWVGLDPQTLNTPYSELIQLCDLLNPAPDEILVDLGAGYGRMGLILNLLHPGTTFIGYELVRERVEEGKRILSSHNCESAELICQDLTDPGFILPDANYYFLYDYGKVPHIRETLKQIEEKADTKSFKVIARGKGSRSLIQHEHPWLCGVNPVHHEENFSIFTF